VACRFIGAVPGSTLLPDLLDGLCRELARLAGDERSSASADVQHLVQEFRQRVATAASSRRLVLFLDALDQLSPSHGARSLNWLPSVLPEGFHLVVSTVNGEVLDTLSGFVPARHRHELRPMSGEDGSLLLDLWLGQDGRTLQKPQRAAVLEAFGASGLPLHLRLAAAEASTWPSYHPAVAVSAEVTGLLHALFTRLSAPAHHGAMLVARSLACIAAGRNGVSEDELLDLLSADTRVMREFRTRSPDSPQTHTLPDIVWSRLYFDLAPYLTQRGVEGTATLDFFHRQLRETVEHDHLTGAAKAARHRALARYFDAQPLSIEAKSAAAPNLRKLGELPFQLAQAGQWRDLEALFTSFAFLRAKLEGLGMLAAVEDFDMARQAARESAAGSRLRQRRGPVQAVQDALRLSAGVLADDVEMLAPQLLGRLRGQHRTLAPMLRDAERQQAHSWLNPLVPSLAKPGGPLNQAIVLDSDIATASLADGGHVLVGCRDGTLRLIALDSGTEAWRVAAHSSTLVDVAYDAPRQRAVTIAADGSVAVWALAGRTRELGFSTDGVAPACVRVAADGSWAFIGGQRRIAESPYVEGVGSIRDLTDGRERARFAARDGGISTAALSPDGSTVVCGSSHGVVRLLDAADAAPIHEFRTHDGSVGAIASDAHGETMLIGSGDQSTGQYNLRLWSRREWRELHVFKGHLWMINSVAITPDGRLGASGGSDATTRVWNLHERRQIACFPGHRGGRVRAVAIAPTGDRVVSASASSLYDWLLDPGLIAQPFHVHEARVTKLAASADGSRAISCAADGTVAIWNLRTLHAERTAAFGSERIAAVAFDRRGRTAIIGTVSGALLRLDIQRGTVTEILRGGESGTVVAIALSRDARLATVAGNETISLVELRTGATRRRFERRIGRHRNPISNLALSAEGRRVVGVSDDFSIYAWELAPRSRAQRRSSGSGVPAFAATPDGRRGVSGTHFGRMFVWDLNPFRRRASLPHQEIGQNSEVSAVAITPDGRRALSGGSDHMIRAWDISSNRCLATFVAEDFTTCACAAGNDLFMAGSRNGAVHVLKVMSGIS
jgi:WD40 repeat protein